MEYTSCLSPNAMFPNGDAVVLAFMESAFGDMSCGAYAALFNVLICGAILAVSLLAIGVCAVVGAWRERRHQRRLWGRVRRFPHYGL